MGIPGSANPLLFGGAAVYEIEQSLRFNSADSAYLNRTPGSAGNRKTWTWSGWLKLGALNQQRAFFAGSTANNDAGFTSIEIRNDNKLYVSGYSTIWRISTQLFRDPSAWYHIVIVWDTTQATANDRIKVYLNGSQITDFDTTNNPSQDATGGVNGAAAHYISTYDGSNWEWDGYLAEVNFIDGSALDPTSFGEYDDNGAWRPIRYAGSYTGNSFYLKFASGDGTDSSGLSNTWTANNFTTSGTGTDVMSDTPTTNYATLNPLDTPDVDPTLSEGNLKWVTNTSLYTNQVRSSIYYPTSGKWYTEVTIENFNTGSGLGYTDIGVRSTDAGANARYLWWVYSSSEVQINTDSGLQNVGSVSVNDVIQVAYDASTGELWFGKNNTWYLSGDPANGTAMSSAATISSASGNTVFYISGRTGSDTNRVIVNFGQRAFEYTPPTGFEALNTANLPAPDIADGGKYFDTKLYTGNNGTLTVTGLGFSPDLVWIKNREVNGAGHAWQDQVRGATAYLFSNSTAAENTNTANDWFRAFTSDGFTVAATTTGGSATSEWNNNGSGYVAWCWDAGGSGSSNTAGSITSTVSANATAGFSIVSATAPSSYVSFSFGHGLGVKPAMVIYKERTGTASWWVWHQGLPNAATGRALNLNSTSGELNGTYWGTIDSSVVTSNATQTTLSAPFVAYCFSEVAGYSKFGSYTGNGSSDGPFVSLGFKPSFLVIKRSDSTESWLMFDSTRETYNPTDDVLWANLSNAESANYTPQDFLSNGFKIKTSSTSTNASGGTYIFMAFAENPFGGDGVSPATAR